MKYLNRLLVLAAVLLPMSVWAEDGTSMQLIENINLYYADDTLYLAQTTNMCEEGKSALLPKTVTKLTAVCLASKDIDKSNSKKTVSYLVNDLLGKYWKKAADVDASQHQASTVVLESDINFGDTLNVTSGTNAGEYDFSCKIKSTYGGLVFSGDAFIGNGQKIFNVCRAIDADKWGTSMGLFQEISGDIVKDLTLDSINFVVLRKVASGEVPNKESKYKPVGALAGTIKNSSVSDITLKHINVSAPLAGGLAGYVESSTFKNVKATAAGSIIVTNDIVLVSNEKNGKMGTFKTVLGGLAGSSKFSTFENIELNLHLENSAKVDSSALGGVAGLYVYADENENKSYLNKKIKITVPSSFTGPVATVAGAITGATSIGGVFGETKRVATNSSTNTRLYIDSVEVTNLKATITNVVGSKSIGVYWGGVVGKSDLCFGGSLKISHAKANVKFDIMQGIDGTYKNYWGGIAGFASCNNTGNYGNDDDLGLSIRNSKATGYMRLGGGAPNKNIYSSSTLGGLVGEALFAVDENSIMLDTAEINITYSAKNKADDAAIAATQNVHAGGIVGAANIFKNSGAVSYWKGLIFKGYLDITDDGFNSYVGGVVGRFPLDGTDNSPIAFKDVLVQTNAQNDDKLIAHTTSGSVSYKSDAFLGGVCGNCKSIDVIEKAAIIGDVYKKASGATVDKSYYVGGLIGSGTTGSFPVTVKNTYSKGDITFGFPSDSKVGYLFGSLSGNNGKASLFRSNYHYNENEEFVVAIADGDGKAYNTFNPAYSISTANVNVHNCATQTLTPSSNGCATSDYMKSQDFATLLNDAWSEPEDQVWEQKVVGALPTLVKSTNVKPTTYVVTFKNGNEVVQEYTVEKNWPSPVPDVPAVDSKGCSFKGWQSDDDYSIVTKAITVNAVYGDCPVYTVTFKGLNGTTLKTVPNVTAGESVTAPTAAEVPEYNGKCFTEWKNTYDLSYVTGNWTIEPNSKTCEYTVTFIYTNAKGKRISQTQTVEYDNDATPPSKSEILQETDDGVCFGGWDYEYTHVKENLEVTEQFVICTYSVVFYDLNSNPIKTVVTENGITLPYPQIVEYGKAAVAPKDPEPVMNMSTGKGRCFDKWSKNTDDYTRVTRNLNVSAYSKDCYQVFFYGLDGQLIVGAKTADEKDLDNPQIVDNGKAAIAPKDPEPTTDGKCFDGWDKTFNNVTGKVVVNAKSKPCEQSSSSAVESSSSEAGSSSSVELSSSSEAESSSSAVQSSSSEAKSSSSAVESSSSEAKSSSSVEQSSSSEAESSSSVEQSSSSEAKSSSSVGQSSSSEANSSSSSVTVQQSSSSAESKSSSSSESYLVKMPQPTLEQEGNALRMTFNDTLADSHAMVDYHIVVKSDAGLYLDTIISGKTVGEIKNGTWRLDPAPVGKYSVSFTLTNGVESAEILDTLEANKEMRVELASDSWQTYSLYVFCLDKGSPCPNQLKERFENQYAWAIEECDQMKGELNNGGSFDEHFYQRMEFACNIADNSEDGSINSVFWWDETNPVGDFWQYRKFNMNQKFDSTRGYWYGPIEDEPLVLGLQTPQMNDEIVWKLENKYSGWNFVANPFGWFIKLPEDESLTICKWNPKAGEYLPTDSLGPYEAVWVKTEKSMTYRIPLKAAIVFEGEKKTLNKSATTENWNLRAVLTDNNGRQDSWNILAAGKSASSLSEPPAGMGDRVNLSIVDGKRRLAKSVKQNSDDLEWNLEASATTSREGHLRFEGLESVLAKGVHVYATIDDETVEVVKDRPLDVQLTTKAKNVSVRVTKSAVTAHVARNLISGFRVNQMSNALNVGFDAASKLAGAMVKVSIVGIDGRVVATSGAVAREGSNAVSMQKPKQGVYFVRLKVGSQTATRRILVH